MFNNNLNNPKPLVDEFVNVKIKLWKRCDRQGVMQLNSKAR